MPMPRARKLLCAALLPAALAGCASGPSGTMLDGFAATDAGGSRAARSISAAMGNGLIGGAMGDRLDPSDRRRALEAEYRALEYSPAGQAVPWQGGDGTVAGQVVAYQPYRVGSQDCRQYAHTVQIGGQSRSLQGAACRNEDGSWTPLV